ncbi:kinase-like domain-containing protein, partial [Mycena galopus ATCC 62051]
NTAQVALKVLRIFQDLTDDALKTLHRKFCEEALVWRSLDHPNIAPFLGVDSSMISLPTVAMVTCWMPHGSVMSYISQNSPCSPYAMQLLRGCIAGLAYLHSVDIVHGDLRGGNVLVDNDGHARLTDFGLARFVDSNTSVSSTRSGSPRWMAPELMVPPAGQPFRRTQASDVWAFGCVCCEVWTEGTHPFPDLPSDGAVVMAFSAHSAPGKIPYAVVPLDKGGSRMPDVLWEVAKSCWQQNGSDRPSAEQAV